MHDEKLYIQSVGKIHKILLDYPVGTGEKAIAENGEIARFNLEQTLKKTIRESEAYEKENENLKEKIRELDRKANLHHQASIFGHRI